MSVERLRAICARAVAANPDLVLLTGDFLTMESQSDPALLRDAFAPLKELPGKVFACHGNHDHESPEVVLNALTANDIALLIDDAREVPTVAGVVQIVGMGLFSQGPPGAARQGMPGASARRGGASHRAAPRSRRVPSLARGRGGSGPVRAHARWTGRSPQPRDAMDISPFVRRQAPGSRVLGARTGPHVDPSRHRPLRVSASTRRAGRGERAARASRRERTVARHRRVATCRRSTRRVA